LKEVETNEKTSKARLKEVEHQNSTLKCDNEKLLKSKAYLKTKVHNLVKTRFKDSRKSLIKLYLFEPFINASKSTTKNVY